MDVLTLNGKRYVKASKAAKDLGYASDYVGQLCRSGTVDAHLVGRTWYVNPDMLGAHRIEKKRNARAKAREHARKSIAESRTLLAKQNTNTAQNITIRYQRDEGELIPNVKRISVVSEKHIKEVDTSSTEGGYTVVNANKKILMSGSIPVYDVDEQVELTDTTILKPRIVKRRSDKMTLIPEAQKGGSGEAVTVRVVESASTESTNRTTTFSEKLAERVETATQHVAAGDVPVQAVDDTIDLVSPRGQTKWLVILALSFITILGSFVSTILESTVVYTAQGTEYGFAIDTADIQNLLSKI